MLVNNVKGEKSYYEYVFSKLLEGVNEYSLIFIGISNSHKKATTDLLLNFHAYIVVWVTGGVV